MNKSFLFFLLLIASFSITQGQIDLKKDFPVLLNTYHLSEKHSDFVIMIDQSGSMKPYWTGVINSISSFIEILPENDYISVYGFNENCSELILSRPITQESKKSINNDLLNLPIPDGKKEGAYTDLFNSVDKALTELNRPNANQLQFIFYFTDFEHFAPQESKWFRTKNVSELITKYHHTVKQTGKIVKVYGLQLPLSSRAGADYELFSSIFDRSVSRLTFNDQRTVSEWFDKLKAIFDREKLKTLVQEDIRSSIRVESVSQSCFAYIYNLNAVKFEIFNQGLLDQEICKLIIRTKENDTIFVAINPLKIKSKSKEVVSIPIENLTKISIREIEFRSNYSEQKELAILQLPLNSSAINNYQAEVPLKKGFTFWGYLLSVFLLAILVIAISKLWFLPEYVFNLNKGRGVKLSIFLNQKQQFLTNEYFAASKREILISDSILKQMDPNIEPFTISLSPVIPRIASFTPKRGTYLTSRSQAGFNILLKDKGKEIAKPLPVSITAQSSPVQFSNEITLKCEYFKNGQQNQLIIKITKA